MLRLPLKLLKSGLFRSEMACVDDEDDDIFSDDELELLDIIFEN